MLVKFQSITPDAEKQIAYCARVSNPTNQNSDNIAKLIRYCIDHAHWSIFEMANLVVEINTTRGLAAQILRHRSFSFQEFSQRYADTTLLADEIPMFELRMQDYKNRQNSLEDIPADLVHKWSGIIDKHFKDSKAIYDGMVADGIAKECARFVLPLATPTRLYMNGSIRSWIHYIQLRTSHGTQKEHKLIAEECRSIFAEQLPLVASALGWV